MPRSWFVASTAILLGAAIAGPPSAAGVDVGVNVVGLDQASDQQQDALIAQLERYQVKTIRTALGGHGERYTSFVIKAYQHGIGSVVMVSPFMGNSGRHASPANPSAGRQWLTPALSDADPDGFRKWFDPELARLEAAGVHVVAFELGNELNTARFNGDFPASGTNRVLGLSDLNNPKDPEGHAVATGYLAYLRVMASLKDARDHSRINRTAAILSSMSANWGLPGPRKPGSMPDAVSVPDSTAFMRQHGLDELADGYSVHIYPNDDPRQLTSQRIAVLEDVGIFASCKKGGKPCWVTEWGLNNTERSCPIHDEARVQVVQSQRAAFKFYADQGRLAAILYYSWSGAPHDVENSGGIFRCGALTDAGKLALSAE